MSWLFPGFLAGALALALPIALHLLRRWPRRPIVFPATRFLVPAMRRTQTRTQRLRRWLVLAFRCAALALLAAAFARPFRGGDANRGSRATVVVVDNSFSLQAGDRYFCCDHCDRKFLKKRGFRAYVGTVLEEAK